MSLKVETILGLIMQGGAEKMFLYEPLVI